MKKIKVKTGYGYFKNTEGVVVSKCELPKGDHPIEGDMEYVECQTREDLEHIQIPDAPKTPEETLEGKIKDELRVVAIERLEARGEI